MNRRTRHLVVLCVAVVTASLASFGVYRAVERIPTPAAELSHASVVVAARTLPIGAQISAKDVKTVAWPSNSQVPGALSSADSVVGRALLTSVLENEPLTEAKVAPRESGAGLPPAIPRGMRAMSVKVNDVIGVAGFVEPGSHVDLLVTIRRRDDSIARTVASNVRVLTSGTRQEQAKAESATDVKGGVSTVVTLMVTPDDAERIALAQSEGQIMLVLRNPLDREQTVTSGVRTESLMGQPEPAAVKAVAATPRRQAVVQQPPPIVPAPAAPRVVEAIRAAKRTEEVIR
jgi:pilus assembly protein CpaB